MDYIEEDHMAGSMMDDENKETGRFKLLCACPLVPGIVRLGYFSLLSPRCWVYFDRFNNTS